MQFTFQVFKIIFQNVQLKVENESIMKELSTNKELLIKASLVLYSYKY